MTNSQLILELILGILVEKECTGFLTSVCRKPTFTESLLYFVYCCTYQLKYNNDSDTDVSDNGHEIPDRRYPQRRTRQFPENRNAMKL